MMENRQLHKDNDELKAKLEQTNGQLAQTQAYAAVCCCPLRSLSRCAVAQCAG